MSKESKKLEYVWISGRHLLETEKGAVWDLQGIFYTKEEAMASCRDKTYWVGKVKFGVSFPHEAVEWGEEDFLYFEDFDKKGS